MQSHLLNTNPHWVSYSAHRGLSVLHSFQIRKSEFSCIFWMRSNRTIQAHTGVRGQSRAKGKCPPRSGSRICLSGISLCLDVIEGYWEHLCLYRTEPISVRARFWVEGNSRCQQNSHCSSTGVNCFPSTVIMVLKIFFSPEFTTRVSCLRTSGRITDLIWLQIKDSRGKWLWQEEKQSKHLNCVRITVSQKLAITGRWNSEIWWLVFRENGWYIALSKF